jgi:23S rRNA (guanosine2251-2'-O)-methyltransferase
MPRPRSERGAPRSRTARPGPASPGRADVVYGRNAVLEAARAGRVRRVIVADGVEPDPRLAELGAALAIERVPRERVDLVAPGNNQGVAGWLRPREFIGLKALLATAPRLLVALDGIQDPQNLGAILRSAEAAGADGVILPERRAAPVTAAVVKASSGASEHLRLCQVAGLASAVSEIRRAGLWCVALDTSGETALWDFDLTQPVCLVVGGEAGLHRLVRQRCDARLRIPISGRVESLNASAAAAVALYEITRQRRS